MPVGLCSWIVFGFIVGLVARAVMPGEQPMGFLRTTALGVGGSFIGGAVASLIMGWSLHFHPAHFIGSVIGALLLLFFFGRERRA